jgi:hypothetical protein
MPRLVGDFARNVFINCPFDDQYLKLLRPLLFTVISLGFTPRLASERSDSLEVRIEKICDLIRESRYTIHDLSRLRASEVGEFYRMNMPFELGIEYGCRRFGSGRLSEKRCLILEKDPHDFRKALSDLSGIDIRSHDDEPAHVVRAVRNWFRDTVGEKVQESPGAIWYRFTAFAAAFYDQRQSEGYSDDDLNMMPVSEYVDFIRHWLARPSARRAPKGSAPAAPRRR